MVYYLKFRPKSLAELKGQEHVVQTLQKALESNKLSHAYLFSGPKGVGKTSTARILAKMINCPRGGGDNCEICQSIDDGSNLDLIEIDSASNRGIDDIREIRDRIKLSPTRLKKKVYIFDEIHMLTNEAFNALLKTLEEPPDHVMFILATTEVSKIPQTILSRVTRLDFAAAGEEALTAVLKNIIKEEKLEVDNDAFTLLVKKSEGSFRDGVKLLDQLSGISNKITKDLIEKNLKLGRFDAVTKTLNLMADKETKQAIILVNEMIKEGLSAKELISGFLDIVRCLILLKYDIDELISKQYLPDQLKVLKSLSMKYSTDDLLKVAHSFQKAYESLKFTSIPSLPLEIAVLERSMDKASVTLGEKLTNVDTLAVRDYPSSHVATNRDQADVDKLVPQKIISKLPAQPQSVNYSGNSSEQDLVVLKDRWAYILEMIHPYNFSLEALLKQVKIHSAREGEVILGVPYSFHQRILETPRNRDLLESVLTDVLGRPTRIGCILQPREVSIDELSNVEVAADDEVIKIAAEIFNS